MKRSETKKKLNSGKGLQIGFVMVAMVILGLMALAPMAATAEKEKNPGVLSPDSTHYGSTYGEWSAKWWQWAFSIPTPQNPLVDDDGSNAANGQHGPVWFLAGKLCSGTCPVATADRTVNVPQGKALFFPILNVENDNLFYSPPVSEEVLRADAKALMDSGENMVAEVDGVPIEGLGSSLTKYRVISPVFNYHIPEDNVYSLFGLDLPKQTVKGAVADGVYVMLAPLPKGTHKIHFKGNFGDVFALDIKYTINVVPQSREDVHS